ncbi:cell division protein ZapE [Pseudomonas chengduensis]|nr:MULTISPECIES: cell division protein ZapE [Pseudomonas]KQO30575.1 ATPase [Pseudomonas sp. Leaf83]MDH0957387.1 cell division protein ZapE [Pseudomonas chengduensis]MDH1535431.1 cell division protein ZapE [Pseudomonas chengduensis]
MSGFERGAPDSPLAAYRRALAGGFVADAAQHRAVEALQHCHEAVHRGERPLGVYLWGPVGRGKTWLMDSFYNALRVPARRQHFHHFMQWVHRRQFQLTGNADPLRLLAEELGREVRVLCFDELFVSDIGDAMLLGRLLSLVVAQGVVLVATSNQPPDQLYADGYNRERFLPAIAALEAHMQVVTVDGEQDHRLHPGTEVQRYWVQQPQVLGELFARLSEGQTISREPVELSHRRIETLGHSSAALWCRFRDLCEQPLAAPDFMELCERFSTILLGEVARLGGEQREGRIARGTEDGAERVDAGDRKLPALSRNDDAVRRFIALVDECYDRRVPLYIEAEVALDELYTQGYLDFAFRRTLSRLREMQLERFGPPVGRQA